MPRRANGQLGTSALVRTSAYVLNEPVRVFSARQGLQEKACAPRVATTTLKGKGELRCLVDFRRVQS